MTTATAASQYNRVAIILHWLIAILIIGQLAGGLYAAGLPREQGELARELFTWHKSFGILILLLSLARIGWRIANPPPPPLPASMKGWEVTVTKVVHFGFYFLLIAIPLFGWAMISSHPRKPPLEFFGLPWPLLPFFGAGSEETHELFEEAHEYGAFAMIALIVIHVAAALKHQFVNRDEVLGRMLPMFKK